MLTNLHIRDNRPKRGIIGGEYMGGSIIKDKRDGKWHISIYWEEKRYRIFKNPVTQEAFFDKRQAEKQLSRIRTEIDDGTFQPKAWFPDSPLSTSQYAENWLKTIDLEPKTKTGYTTTVKKYIKPFFGDKDIRNIRYNDIVALKNSMPLSKKTVYNHINVLKKILKDAWRNEDIKSVPPFPVLSFDEPEIEYLELNQQEIILNAIPEKDRPIFQFMMEYGVRPQEARALQKDCIRNGQVIIKRVFSENKLVERTKTGDKGRRIFGITSYFQNVLNTMQKNLSPFLFLRIDSKPYTNKDLNKIWHKAEQETGIKCKLYNAVRHSLGCQLIDQGEDFDLVRQTLGHTNERMTRRYAKRKTARITEALERRSAKIINLNINEK
jgi:integrase